MSGYPVLGNQRSPSPPCPFFSDTLNLNVPFWQDGPASQQNLPVSGSQFPGEEGAGGREGRSVGGGQRRGCKDTQHGWLLREF